MRLCPKTSCRRLSSKTSYHGRDRKRVATDTWSTHGGRRGPSFVPTIHMRFFTISPCAYCHFALSCRVLRQGAAMDNVCDARCTSVDHAVSFDCSELISSF
jgi:hypothetical protein